VPSTRAGDFACETGVDLHAARRRAKHRAARPILRIVPLKRADMIALDNPSGGCGEKSSASPRVRVPGARIV